jgi:hypothetical protein
MVLLFHFVGTVPPGNRVECAIVGVTNYGAYGVVAVLYLIWLPLRVPSLHLVLSDLQPH